MAEMAKPMSLGYQLLVEVGFLYLIPALRDRGQIQNAQCDRSLTSDLALL